jgi:hypothetical protein
MEAGMSSNPHVTVPKPEDYVKAAFAELGQRRMQVALLRERLTSAGQAIDEQDTARAWRIITEALALYGTDLTCAADAVK